MHVGSVVLGGPAYVSGQITHGDEIIAGTLVTSTFCWVLSGSTDCHENASAEFGLRMADANLECLPIRLL